MDEQWKSAFGWEGYYEVSNKGRVRSLHPHSRSGGILRPFRLNNGYWAVNLSAEKRRKLSSIHRLVLEAFLGPIPEGMEGSHLDGNRANNALANLAIETPAQNARRRIEHGTQSRNLTNCKINAEQAQEIRALAKTGMFQREIAARFGITQSNVSKLLSGSTWRGAS